MLLLDLLLAPFHLLRIAREHETHELQHTVIGGYWHDASIEIEDSGEWVESVNEYGDIEYTRKAE